MVRFSSLAKRISPYRKDIAVIQGKGLLPGIADTIAAVRQIMQMNKKVIRNTEKVCKKNIDSQNAEFRHVSSVQAKI